MAGAPGRTARATRAARRVVGSPCAPGAARAAAAGVAAESGRPPPARTACRAECGVGGYCRAIVLDKPAGQVHAPAGRAAARSAVAGLARGAAIAAIAAASADSADSAAGRTRAAMTSRSAVAADSAESPIAARPAGGAIAAHGASLLQHERPSSRHVEPSAAPPAARAASSGPATGVTIASRPARLTWGGEGAPGAEGSGAALAAGPAGPTQGAIGLDARARELHGPSGLDERAAGPIPARSAGAAVTCEIVAKQPSAPAVSADSPRAALCGVAAEHVGAIERRQHTAGDVEAAPRTASTRPTRPTGSAVARMERPDETAAGRSLEHGKPIAAAPTSTARAALGRVALHQVAHQGQAARSQIDAAAPRVCPCAAAAARPSSRMRRGRRPADRSARTQGPSCRVVHHRDVGQGHVAAVDQEAAAQGRGTA